MAACNNTTTTTTTTTTVTTVDSATTVAPVVDTVHELLVLDSALKHFETAPQTFKAPVNHLVKFTGVKGAVITVDGNDLETISGKPFGNHIDVDLKELVSTEDLARNRINTATDAGLLDCGGAYYLDMSTGGEPLQPRKDKVLALGFPATDKPLTVYSGVLDSILHTIVWQNNGAHLVSDQPGPDAAGAAISKLAHIDSGVQKMGWLLTASPVTGSATTDISFRISGADSLNYVACWLMFRKPCSVWYKNCHPQQPVTVKNVPLGAKARFVVVGYRNGKYYTARQSMAISSAQVLPIKLVESSEKDVAALFVVK